jgi:hypothetical protein
MATAEKSKAIVDCTDESEVAPLDSARPDPVDPAPDPVEVAPAPPEAERVPLV